MKTLAYRMFKNKIIYYNRKKMIEFFYLMKKSMNEFKFRIESVYWRSDDQVGGHVQDREFPEG
ncbi:hypothetical protein BLOT_005508 [Blomia tropicalis]|nr:hypothetical protein BLOT_005508 [Blomia tropicalis]